MTFAQRRNHLTTHFSERIPVVERSIYVCMNIYIYIYIEREREREQEIQKRQHLLGVNSGINI